MLRRHHRPLGRLILALEIIANILHLHPPDARLAADILDQSLQHENHVRMARDVRVDRHGKAKIVVLPVKEVEVVSPQVLDVLWVYPPVRVGRFLDEHHWGEIVQIPICGDLDEAGVRAFLQGLHPVVGVFAVVDWRPFVTSAEVVGQTVVMGEAVIFHLVSK